MSTPIVNEKFDIERHNRRIYSPKMFEKALEEYVRKVFLEDRVEKIKKINEKIKNNNKT